MHLSRIIKTGLIMCAPCLGATPHKLANPTSNPRSFGLGVIVGEPTGISAKKWVGDNQAVDGGVAYSFDSKTSSALAFVDYLWHFPDVVDKTQVSGHFSPYFGLGGGLSLESSKETAKTNESVLACEARLPLGIEWIMPNIPLGLAIEIVPSFKVLPETRLALHGGFAVRYYF